MVPQFQSNLYASVYLFAEYRYMQWTVAFQNAQIKFYYAPDPQLPTGYRSYASPWRQFVYDSGVSGAAILNVVSGGPSFATYPLTRASGLYIDYEHGRVIVPAAFGTALTLTGYGAFKEVNMYQPTESEEQLLTQSKFFVNPRYRSAATSGMAPYVMATPGIFLNMLSAHNDAYQFGGMVDTKTTMSMVILAESQFQLRALFSIFSDCKYQYIPMLNTVDDVLNEYGDYKGGTGFNYITTCSMFGRPGNLIYVENVRTARVSDKLKMNPGIVADIVDLELSYIRSAPITTNVFV